jgi:hypothetical protein
MNRPYSLDYARLASGAFFETIVLATFDEIIKSGNGHFDSPLSYSERVK